MNRQELIDELERLVKDEEDSLNSAAGQQVANYYRAYREKMLFFKNHTEDILRELKCL